MEATLVVAVTPSPSPMSMYRSTPPIAPHQTSLPVDLAHDARQPVLRVSIDGSRPAISNASPGLNALFDGTAYAPARGSTLLTAKPESDLIAGAAVGKWQTGYDRRRTAVGYRTLEIQAIPIARSGTVESVYLTYRDVTDRHCDQERLAVLSRVFRHDLRHVINLIEGYARHSACTSSQSKETIIDACQRLHRIDQMTTRLRRLKNTKVNPISIDRFVEVIDLPPNVDLTAEANTLRIDDRLTAPLEELLTHCVDDAAQKKTVRIDSDTKKFLVVKCTIDAPDVTEEELKALNGTGETSLQHGTGVDLWAVRWMIMCLNGMAEAVKTDETLRVRIEVPRWGAAA